MNPKNYKITKLAIEQNNLELLKLILNDEKPSNEQLSECLTLAQDKKDIFNELSNQVEEEKKEFIIKMKDYETTDNSKLVEACYQYYLKDVPIKLWTSEEVDLPNSHGFTLLHLLAMEGTKSSTTIKYLEKALALSKNPTAKNIDGETPLKLAYDCDNFGHFKKIWKVTKQRMLDNSNKTLLEYILMEKNNIKEKYFEFLLCEEKYDIRYEAVGTLKKIFMEINWEGLSEKEKDQLLGTGKFILDKTTFNIHMKDKYPGIVEDFINYCPDNIEFTDKKIFYSYDGLIDEYFIYDKLDTEKSTHDCLVYTGILVIQDFRPTYDDLTISKGSKYNYLHFNHSTCEMELVPYDINEPSYAFSFVNKIFV